MTTAYDLKERRRAVVNAVASQRLEGLEPDSRTIAELDRVAEGTSSVSDLINTLRSRVAAGEFRTPPSPQR
ncbi:antitoxin VbhA family protein [Achromobacter mucicolens]|uniref:Antitoxin VbhA family protein n=1 Tax=Achromobacter mucicolens TaxID=1389922 RepID=A0ABD4Z126_9BURK|nr:antitoxin VbhA family protein [Achromobacter mucicolens]MDG9971594.1 antitoxin VbhA family protein [Achromobacter mucicolens]MDH1181271.1 antitoxin VbhA family protein [Achromobacter mucicolens]